MSTRRYIRIACSVFSVLTLAGCGDERSARRTYRIWQDPQEQTIAFEPSDLPGNIFKIVIPEIITDRKETLVGWDQRVDAWRITADRAGWTAEIPGRIRMDAEDYVGRGHCRGWQTSSKAAGQAGGTNGGAEDHGLGTSSAPSRTCRTSSPFCQMKITPFSS